MNYVPVAAGTTINESIGIQGELNAGTSKEISQDCIMMPIWKDASYFDSPSKDVDIGGEPKSAADDQKQVEDGLDNEYDEKYKSDDDSSPKEVNDVGQHDNTASPDVNTGSFKLNTVDPSVNTASSYDQDSPKDMFTMGASHTLEATFSLFSFLLFCLLILVDLPSGKRAIGTKWVFRNKKDERGIVIRNKARTIKEEVYVTQPPGFKDPNNPDKVYKVVKALYGLHQASRAWYETLANYLLGNRLKRGKIDQTLFIKKQKGDILLVQMSSMGELTFFLGLQVQQKEDGIFISQDKYVDEILKKFNYIDVKSALTPVDLEKPLVKDGDANDVDVHLYRSMIGSLMYLTASRPDIMFAVCACARFQVTPKTSHLLAVKRIFRYLKGTPTLGLWYPRDSLFELVSYTDSDNARATQDRKSTTRAEYVAATSCCRQVLWIQNQLLDYGYNFMNTMIHIDNNSTICIIENPVQHSKTKHIEIRQHFIRDCNAKKLIQMVKIDTEHNVADLLTKGFNAGRISNVVDEAIHKELGDSMERAATTASSLEAEQDSEFCDKHNMVAYLEKSEGSEGFHEIIDFLFTSHIHYALTTSPTIYTSLIEQFWQTDALCTIDDRVLGITATIDKKVKITVLEGSIRRNLKLEDSEGIPSLPTAEIFKQLALMGVITPLFDIMLVQHQVEEPSIQTTPETSPSKITSSPSLSMSASSTSQPPITPTEEPVPMPHESPLHSVYSLGHDEGNLEKDLQQTKKTYSTALTKLILRVKKLEKIVKTGKARRRARNVLSEDKYVAEDSSKQGRKISDIDTDPTISLVQPRQDMEYNFDVKTAEGFTTASASISTVSPPRVSTAEDISGAETLVYIRRSASKAKDKGKAIMQESEPPKKIKKRVQVQMSIDEELAKKLHLDEREEVAAKEAHDIDWSDPSVLRYHTLQNRPFSVAEVRKNMCMYLKNQGGYKMSHFKGMRYEEIRPIFEKVWDQIQSFVPMDSEKEKGSKKKTEESSRTAGGRRKKSLARKRAKETLSEESAKKQKLEDDVEKEELQVYLNIVPEEESLDVESLATK
ncbi:putative ribonuclease H-like domain-containing protein, partial [Tanacetum coccineum]